MSRTAKATSPDRVRVGRKMSGQIEELIITAKAARLKATVLALELAVLAIDRDLKRATKKARS
jgi:hypothetical protein